MAYDKLIDQLRRAAYGQPTASPVKSLLNRAAASLQDLCHQIPETGLSDRKRVCVKCKAECRHEFIVCPMLGDSCDFSIFCADCYVEIYRSTDRDSIYMLKGEQQ